MYGVGELCRALKRVVEESFEAGLWVEGEISNYRLVSSGHAYFTLKDETATLSAVLFRGNARGLRFAPQDGMKVLAFGSLGIYEAQSKYQLIVQRLEPQGIGGLQLAFDQLKKKLTAEGLFEAARKKAVPMLPQRIAIITSPTGAAIRDILTVLNRRFSNLEITIMPVPVQGEGAAGKIAEALAEVNAMGGFDVVLITRGGGSLEDLWAFNEEVLARAVAASALPTISAVGHEIDITICDMVADLRCATPSAAAELLVAPKQDLLNSIRALRDALAGGLENLVSRYAHRLQLALRSGGLKEPGRLLELFFQRLDDAKEALPMGLSRWCQNSRHVLSGLAGQLNALSPLGVLGRGYSITFRGDGGEILREASEVKAGEAIVTRLGKGRIRSNVVDVENN